MNGREGSPSRPPKIIGGTAGRAALPVNHEIAAPDMEDRHPACHGRQASRSVETLPDIAAGWKPAVRDNLEDPPPLE